MSTKIIPYIIITIFTFIQCFICLFAIHHTDNKSINIKTIIKTTLVSFMLSGNYLAIFYLKQ